MAQNKDIRALTRQYANLCYAFASCWAQSTRLIERIAAEIGTDAAKTVMEEGKAMAKDMLDCRAFAYGEQSQQTDLTNTCKL